MAIEKELLDKLLAGRDPKDVFNKDGLVDELKKALSERILNTELDEHLRLPGRRAAIIYTTDEMDKRFFHDRDDDCRNRVRPFFCSAAPRAILPSRPPISQPPRAGAVKAGRVCGHRKAWP